MAPKPFKHDPKLMAESLTTAADLLVEALDILTTAKVASENWAEYGTMQHFATELGEFMSSDDGEAGLMPYITKFVDKVTA